MKHEVNAKSVFNWMIIGCLSGVLGTGCIAQKADLQKIHKDLDKQLTQIRTEKKELEKELVAARGAIAESRNLIAEQKAEIQKMQNNLAPRIDLAQLNHEVKLMRQEDLPKLYGKDEEVEKKISDLQKNFAANFAAHEKNFSTTAETLSSDIQALQKTVQTQGEQQQLTQTEVTTLVQQVDEKNQALTKQMTEFQTAFGQFKETLGSLGTDISQTQTDIETIKADLTTQDQVLRTFKTDMTTQDQALRTFLEQDVKTAMDELVANMDARQRPVLERIDALQSDMETLGAHVQAEARQVQEFSQSLVKLREAQAVMGSLLGKRGDEIIQQAGRLSEQMKTVESHQATLAEQLQSNTKKTSNHLKEVNASLTTISQNLDQTTQSLSQRLTQQEKTVATLNQAIQEFQQLKGETQGQIQQMQTASQITEQLRQNVEQIKTRLQGLEIHQSEIVGKLDSDAQTTTTHLQEVNKGIKSVAQALENVSAKLNARIASQEQQLNRAITSFQSVQSSAEAAQTNVQHLNELTETVNQLRGVINTIGTKLGERVDSHEDRLGQLAQRVNHLQGKPKK